MLLRALIFIIFTSFLLFFPFSFGLYERMSEHVFDLGHLPFFGLMTFFALKKIGSFKKVTLCLACFGILIEVVQFFTGRSASVGDFFNDLSGIALGCGFFYYPKFILIFNLVWLIISLNSIKKLSSEVELLLWRKANFPILFLDSHKATWEYVKNTKSLKLNSGELFYRSDNDYVGVEYSAVGEKWTGFTTLHLELDSSCPLTIRIDDNMSDGSFESRFTSSIQPQNGEIAIKLADIKANDRALDLTAVQRLIIYYTPASACNEFTLKKVELLK